ncbi:MAG: class I SAM-dependent methyltransferase [Aquabacterium sp.]|uniref:class I SAM-dependent methyltransferase n=1 Tax=Aquabacterium sp. TaxID=1872578 RepID=UPI0025B7B150|nr:class I SAM-dependent methyltransferase [Aquabacterium sp.]MBI5927646.1 class I SAM-dependent methyltransferase [Aquabacterium sp.]
MSAENWWERHVLPYLIDQACGIRPVARQREKVVPQARGQVLEIGIGTGLNIPFYDKTKVTRIVGVDPALRMHRLADKRIAKAGLNVELIGLSAEKLPVADASFDTVVCTYTLCTIPDPAAALAEMRRVLKPGGKLLFSEHGRAPDEGVARWQTRLQPYWSKIAGGCMLDRDVPLLLKDAGFDAATQSRYLPGPRFVSYHYWGEASAA